MSTHEITRRTVVGGAAVLPTVAALPAVAAIPAGPDPIYAAIEAHQRARADFDAVLWQIDTPERWGKHHPMRKQMDAMEMEASDAEKDTLLDVLELPATTVAGLVAGIRYLQSITDVLDVCDTPQEFFDSLAIAMERVIGAPGGVVVSDLRTL